MWLAVGVTCIPVLEAIMQGRLRTKQRFMFGSVPGEPRCLVTVISGVRKE